MKKMTLREIQLISLDILKEIHAFCVKHKIRYSLAYGTLIGAIRHKGFIPWDDDLDIVMPREDYERFIHEYIDNDNYKLYAPEKGNSLLLYARMCEMKKTHSWSIMPWRREKAGVFIDIFPIDGVPADRPAWKNHIDIAQKLRTESFYNRWYLFRPSCSISLIQNIRCTLRMFRLYSRSKFVESNLSEYQDLLLSQNYKETGYCGQIACLVYPTKEYMPYTYYSDYVLVDFEGSKFYATSEYDKVLRNYYGDYMQMPSVEDRIPKHSSAQIMYWK